MNYRERHSRQDKVSRRVLWLMIAICLVATLVYLKSRLWVFDLSYEFSSLQKELTQLKNENADLRLEVGKLKAPGRIEKIARTRLGLKSREEMKQNMTVVLRQ
jgi:cell division protein FtsL